VWDAVPGTIPDTTVADLLPSTQCLNATGEVVASAVTIGSKGYASISEALESVTDRTATTITLLKDTEDNVEIAASRNITLDLNGKNLTGNIANNGTLTISDGTRDNSGAVTGQITNGTDCSLTITGGTFSFDPTEFVPGTYVINENTEAGTYTVAAATGETAVARIGDAFYRSLTQAIASVTDETTITLLKDTAEDIADPVKAFTLDLNGKAFTGAITSTAGKLSITGTGTLSLTTGVFGNDVTKYCAAGYAATADNAEPPTAYTVGAISTTEQVSGAASVGNDKTEAATTGSVGSGVTGDEQVVQAAKETAESVKVKDITEKITTDTESIAEQNDAVTKLLANDIIKVNESTGEITLNNNGEAGAAATVTVVHEVYLDVETTAYDAAAKTIKMAVEPKYNVKAVVSSDGVEDKEIILESGKAAAVGEDTTVTMSLTLPDGFVDTTAGAQSVWVKHIKEDGTTVYYYKGTVEKGSQKLSFDNPDGFSEFEVGTDEVVAYIGNTGYGSLQAAVDKAGSNAEITVLKTDETAITVSKPLTIKLAATDGTIAIKVTNGSGYRMTKSDDTYTFTRISYSYNPGNSSPIVDAGDSVNSTPVENEDGASAIVTENEDGTVTAEVTVPEGVEKTTIVIPVTNATAGLVAKDANGKIVKLSVVNETGDGLAVTLTESTTLTIVDNSRTYTDVADDYWGANYIAFASAHELFKSTGDDVSFEPDAQLSRYMMMTILGRLADQEMNDTGADWYVDGQSWAVAQGISDGYNGDRNITREEMVTMLWRYAGKPAADADGADVNDFADAGDVSEYAKEAMAWAVSVGIINGVDGNKIAPQGNAQRAQVAKIVMKYCEVVTK
jgi:hypothetical protein